MLKAILLVSALFAAPMAQASDWSASAWAKGDKARGACQLDAAGSAFRQEVREVSCVSSDGTKLRDQDCDPAKRPQIERMVSCKMAWDCSEWLDGVYGEADKIASTEWIRDRGDKVGASLACTNAKEANPSEVSACRALKMADQVEMLASTPKATSANVGYAMVTCRMAAR